MDIPNDSGLTESFVRNSQSCRWLRNSPSRVIAETSIIVLATARRWTLS